MLFSMVSAPIYIPTNHVGGFPFLCTLSSIVCGFFHETHFDWCEVFADLELTTPQENRLLVTGTWRGLLFKVMRIFF